MSKKMTVMEPEDEIKALRAERDELRLALEHTLGVLREAESEGFFSIAQAASIIWKARAALKGGAK